MLRSVRRELRMCCGAEEEVVVVVVVDRAVRCGDVWKWCAVAWVTRERRDCSVRDSVALGCPRGGCQLGSLLFLFFSLRGWDRSGAMEFRLIRANYRCTGGGRGPDVIANGRANERKEQRTRWRTHTLSRRGRATGRPCGGWRVSGQHGELGRHGCSGGRWLRTGRGSERAAAAGMLRSCGRARTRACGRWAHASVFWQPGQALSPSRSTRRAAPWRGREVWTATTLEAERKGPEPRGALWACRVPEVGVSLCAIGGDVTCFLAQ